MNKNIDHKKIGNNLNMFFFSKNIWSGLPIWLPNGLYIYNKIKKFIKKINLKNKYEEISTPHFGNDILYNISGHLKKYYKNIFKLSLKKHNIFLKPMNCPFHCEIYKNKYNNISYKDLPIKFFEFGTVYRKEKSGELNGLFRTKMFTQDDGHIFCTNKHIYNEIINIIKIIKYILKFFNFNNFYIRISLKSKKKKNNIKYIGNNKIWEKSEKILLKIKNKIQKKYNVYIKYGDAAFYGPKIDFIINDSLNREWQLSTIQIDYNTPIRFNLKYINKNKICKPPVMIHRAFLGSIERFIAILIENTNGNLPIWLLKIQLVIIPIKKKNYKYSKNIFFYLIKKGIKCIIDNNKYDLNKKIKKYEKNKIPFIFIIGDNEEKKKKISMRINNKIKILKKEKALSYVLKKNINI